jgi:xylulokinase
MIADVFELPVEIPLHAEGAAFGAALQALWACETSGDAPTLAAIAHEHSPMVAERGTTPDATTADAYGAAYEQFLRQLDSARSLYSTLNRTTAT